ncbi:hypothetical protein, partial [Acidithiobacillus caldus]|uniref:hypothetical protein n=1 Tax=Acidithiobacillus caldus TaxID=33059 RepID=UPI001A7E0848
RSALFLGHCRLQPGLHGAVGGGLMGVLRLESENGPKKTATADKTGLIGLPIRQFLTKSDSATAFLRIFSAPS